MSEVRVWAPRARRVELVIAEPGGLEREERTVVEMAPGADGWFTADSPAAVPGHDYGFSLEGGPLLQDPRSRRQPSGLHGPSRFWRDEQPWNDGNWTGRGLSGAVFYELHVGTFTEEGTLDAAIEHLEHLVSLGVTHVELLPLNDFNGEWNWGYDGVLWYAVHEAYGGPDALHRFVDACHGAGLAVCLDVVYNHLGPGGDLLEQFGPYLASGTNTWGRGLNLDEDQSAAVRAHLLENALMWLIDFHVDALRIDAVHALVDRSRLHVLGELSTRVEELEVSLGRPITLIAESDLNDPKVVSALPEGWGLDAQWDDDVHHALHALLTGERQAYYVDFGSLATVAKVLQRGFFHDGTYSTFRRRPHGHPVPSTMPTERFVAYLQNHDQVGNRAAGERLAALVSPDLLAVGATLLLTSPFTPMLFMGEEWGETRPWPFFTSHPQPELAAAVSEGRAEEFREFDWDASRVPDPQDPETFYKAKLDWGSISSDWHAWLLDVYRRLLQLRREHPGLWSESFAEIAVEVDERARLLRVRHGELIIAANLSEVATTIPIDGASVLFATSEPHETPGGVVLGPRSAVVLG